MDKDKLMHKRLFLGWLCHIAAIIALISVLDALAAAHRKPANDLDIIAGDSFKMTGNVYGNVKSAGDISVVSDSPDLTLEFEKDLFSGYWLGIEMWRAELKTAPGLKPGRYTMKIVSPGLSEVKPEDRQKLDSLLTYSVNVYGDVKSKRKGSLSLINRFFGVSAWYPAIGFFLMALLAGAGIFVISGKIDAEMAKQGVAEIYRVSKNEGGVEVFFGLGLCHGLQAGEKLGLFNESGEFLKEVVVGTIGKQTSSAVVDILKIKTGFMVARLNNYSMDIT